MQAHPIGGGCSYPISLMDTSRVILQCNRYYTLDTPTPKATFTKLHSCTQCGPDSSNRVQTWQQQNHVELQLSQQKLLHVMFSSSYVH